MLETFDLTGTVSAGGAGTFTSERPVVGLLYSVEWVDGTLDDNNTAVLSVVGGDSAESQTLLTLGAGEGDDDKWYYPRILAHDNAATELASTYAYMVVTGTLSLVIASGGTSTTGGAIVTILS